MAWTSPKCRGQRADVAHPGAQDSRVPQPTWSQGMQQAFQRWEPATTSLDFQRGDDPEVSRGARGDAASIGAPVERDPWAEIIEVEDAGRVQQDVEGGERGRGPLRPASAGRFCL